MNNMHIHGLWRSCRVGYPSYTRYDVYKSDGAKRALRWSSSIWFIYRCIAGWLQIAFLVSSMIHFQAFCLSNLRLHVVWSTFCDPASAAGNIGSCCLKVLALVRLPVPSHSIAASLMWCECSAFSTLSMTSVSRLWSGTTA